MSLRAAAVVATISLGLASATWAQTPQPFSLSSPAFADGAMLAKKNAGNNKASASCTGENVSPPFEWSNVPDGTKSFAFLMYDPEGRGGLGVSHQVAYGIPGSARGFKEGELALASSAFVGGKSTPGATVYYGPCPPFNSGMHHYIFTVIATDLEPTALEAGLTREQLFEKLNGHAKMVAGVVGRFSQ